VTEASFQLYDYSGHIKKTCQHLPTPRDLSSGTFSGFCEPQRILPPLISVSPMHVIPVKLVPSFFSLSFLLYVLIGKVGPADSLHAVEFPGIYCFCSQWPVLSWKMN
jgi:hypothetical protein